MAIPYAEVIGDPIAHSKSPLIHKFWLAKLGIEGDYRRCRVRAEELAAYFTERGADPAWRGCNITVPHKVAAMASVRTRNDVRMAVGAINTAVRNSDAIDGANTDITGFIEPLADVDLAGREVAVIGAGGAARAVVWGLMARNIGRLTLLNRSRDKAEALLSRLPLDSCAVPLDAPLPPARLLVNASTLGMTGQPPLAPDLTPLPADAIVYDIVYAPLATPLLLAARSRGLRTIDGLHMLIGQAAAAFELFFGQPAPREHDAELRALLTA